MGLLRGVIGLVLALLASVCAGRRLHLVVPEADAHGCGDACCCAPVEPAAASSCCSKDSRDDLPRLVAACGCGGPGELHLAIAVGPWTLPDASFALLAPPRSRPTVLPSVDPESRLGEPPTPPPRSRIESLPA